MKKKKIVVDRGNAGTFWKVMNELREGRSEIEKMLHSYPLELSASGFYRFVMNIGEVDEIIADIDKGLALYRRQKPKHRRPCDISHLRLEKRATYSKAKAADFHQLVEILQQNREFIKDQVSRYPLECVMVRMRFVFCDVREVDWLIGELKRWARRAEKEERASAALASLP